MRPFYEAGAYILTSYPLPIKPHTCQAHMFLHLWGSIKFQLCYTNLQLGSPFIRAELNWPPIG